MKMVIEWEDHAGFHRVFQEDGMLVHQTRTFDILIEEITFACDEPPAGWWCSRERGHDGPCPARRCIMQ